ncbi:hypothetical protein [Nostoc sp. TCL240-02]|uniref:hypothetical protein n=1 Tax=Nostoc sp. TCL240-02 TaxID=2572090 RepID=UPI00157FB2FC|nr:hypothetical protein [Nostoc sp. TCL240-02]QKQ73426.1 hypothetical protein FBB35_08790 [Nostoc sp. TCL240-02]
MQVDATKVQVDATKVQVDATKVQVDATKVQVNAIKVQVDATKAQVDAIKAQGEHLNFCKYNRQLEIAATQTKSAYCASLRDALRTRTTRTQRILNPRRWVLSV